jgi:hypothetical protein
LRERRVILSPAFPAFEKGESGGILADCRFAPNPPYGFSVGWVAIGNPTSIHKKTAPDPRAADSANMLGCQKDGNPTYDAAPLSVSGGRVRAVKDPHHAK